ncbi:MAG TPA: hypothetical protein VED40_03880 [Azospirillaceae bacterium]|nr:hypothetical protein [Azospirillaceae bacterium]
MRLKSNIKAFFEGVLRPDHEGHRYVSTTTQFLPLDVEQIKAEFKLVQHGRERGGAEQPEAADSNLDMAEQAVVTAIGTEVKKAVDQYASGLHTLAQRVANLDLRGRAAEIEVRAKNAMTEFRKGVHDGLDRLFNERREVAEAEAELRDFREQNRLKRPARYPLSRTYHIAIIVLILLAESVLNGVFFARGNAAGIVGGVVMAFTLALGNILLGAVLGRFAVPYAGHRSWGLRLLGLTGLLVLPALLLLYNLGVAHYRDALGGDAPELAAQAALASLKADLLDIKDIESWMLVLAGIAFGLIAAFDTYRFDDPYPGYGRIWRRVQEANEFYAEEKRELTEELADIKNGAVEEMERIRQDVSHRKGQFINMIGSRDQLRANFTAHLDHLEACANDLLRTYRDANKAARRTPPPPHFAARWPLPRPGEPEIDPFAGLSATIFDEETEKVVTALQRYIDELNAAFLEAMGQYKRIDQLSLKDFENGATPDQAAAVPA